MEELDVKERLTEKQITELADEISVTEMTKIAIKYLNIKKGVIGNIKVNNPGDAEAQSRAILRKWANRNPENQVKVCSVIVEKYNMSSLIRWLITLFENVCAMDTSSLLLLDRLAEFIVSAIKGLTAKTLFVQYLKYAFLEFTSQKLAYFLYKAADDGDVDP